MASTVKTDTHSCYILYNANGQTYNGYTVCFERRLRQHNSEIKGGAKFTSNKGPWKYLVKVQSEYFDSQLALRYEWQLKYPTNKRPRPREYNGPLGRIQSIPLVIANQKFANIPMQIQVAPEYFNLLRGLCAPFDHIEVTILE